MYQEKYYISSASAGGERGICAVHLPAVLVAIFREVQKFQAAHDFIAGTGMTKLPTERLEGVCCRISTLEVAVVMPADLQAKLHTFFRVPPMECVVFSKLLPECQCQRLPFFVDLISILFPCADKSCHQELDV